MYWAYGPLGVDWIVAFPGGENMTMAQLGGGFGCGRGAGLVLVDRKGSSISSTFRDFGSRFGTRGSRVNVFHHTSLAGPVRASVAHSVFASLTVEAGDGDPIREWITGEAGATKITKISPVGGGCINSAFRYDTDVGSFFVKTSRDIGPAMFEAEATGLNAMFATSTIRVPKPYKVGALSRRGSFIIMEYIKMGSLRGGQAELGARLAEMHKAGTTDKGFGFYVDNTIGSTPQKNPWTSDWGTFFRDHRLGYQFQLIEEQYRDFDIVSKGQKLLEKLPYFFKDMNIQPCLLHGDLWSGNIGADENGAPVILDPACYYGHSEAEFGMSWCAGFGDSFYNAYFKILPKQPGFEQRRELYRLYHYLNHYNLFGSSYRSSSIDIIRTFVNNN